MSCSLASLEGSGRRAIPVEERDHVHATTDAGGLSQRRTGLCGVPLRLQAPLCLCAALPLWPGRSGRGCPRCPGSGDRQLPHLCGALTTLAFLTKPVAPPPSYPQKGQE